MFGYAFNVFLDMLICFQCVFGYAFSVCVFLICFCFWICFQYVFGYVFNIFLNMLRTVEGNGSKGTSSR